MSTANGYDQYLLDVIHAAIAQEVGPAKPEQAGPLELTFKSEGQRYRVLLEPVPAMSQRQAEPASAVVPPLHPTDGPVHDWFGLSYCNYQVLQRTFMQSMPIEWQARMVACLEELYDAFRHVPQAEIYDVTAATEHIVNEMNPAELERAGIDVEDDEDRDPMTTYHRRADGAELEGYHRVLLPAADPVPHYNRGRTYIEPRPAS